MLWEYWIGYWWQEALPGVGFAGEKCNQELERGAFIPTVISCGLGRQSWDLIQEDLGDSQLAELTHWNVLLPGHSPLPIIM